MSDQHKALIQEGRSLPLAEAVREILTVAGELMDDSRPAESHGGAYLSRWRVERLRASLESAVESEGASRPSDEEVAREMAAHEKLRHETYCDPGDDWTAEDFDASVESNRRYLADVRAAERRLMDTKEEK